MLEVVFRVVKEFSVVKVKLTNNGEERLKRLTAEGKCLACERPVAGEKVVCGCCVSCDQSQRYAMRIGRVTLQELIAAGERQVKKTGGRKPKTAYSAKLLGRTGEIA
jgi:hypothetical protein